MREAFALQDMQAFEWRKQEKETRDTPEFLWAIYASSRDGDFELSYEKSFRDLMGGKFTNFDNWIEMRKEESGGLVHVVDYMGTGDVVKSSDKAPADSVLAVTLSDLRNDEQKLREPKKTVFETNLFITKNWRIIKKYQENRGIDGFDLSFFRPMGAVMHSGIEMHEGEYLRLYIKMLQNAYELMSNENGILLFQLPDITSDIDAVLESVFDAWQERLQKNGILVYKVISSIYNDDLTYLKLIKTPEATKKLPIFSLQELIDASGEGKTLDDRLPLKGP